MGATIRPPPRQRLLPVCRTSLERSGGDDRSRRGEAAANGLTAEQLRWPGSALLMAFNLIHRVSEGDGDDDGDMAVGSAIAYGLNLGATASPLLAECWEEGWRIPLVEWHARLGIRPIP